MIAELSPAGLASVQAWASQCVSIAFVVGVSAGLIGALGLTVGTRLYALILRAHSTWQLNSNMARWECTEEAAELRKEAREAAFNDHQEALFNAEYEERLVELNEIWARAAQEQLAR